MESIEEGKAAAVSSDEVVTSALGSDQLFEELSLNDKASVSLRTRSIKSQVDNDSLLPTFPPTAAAASPFSASDEHGAASSGGEGLRVADSECEEELERADCD
jgi:hypothetical protein